MARDRQRAKRRQAERREARLREQRQPPSGDRGVDTDGAIDTDGGPAPSDRGERRRTPAEAPPATDRVAPPPEVGAPGLDPAAEARLAAAAPPEDTGRSDTVVESPPPAPSIPEEEESGRPERATEPREGERGRVAAFLAAVWAELQRVQWPDRKTLITLTGVVLGFVVIMGAYLGGLDAIFSWLLQRIL